METDSRDGSVVARKIKAIKLELYPKFPLLLNELVYPLEHCPLKVYYELKYLKSPRFSVTLFLYPSYPTSFLYPYRLYSINKSPDKIKSKFCKNIAFLAYYVALGPIFQVNISHEWEIDTKRRECESLFKESLQLKLHLPFECGLGIEIDSGNQSKEWLPESITKKISE
ncbi:hypothetical protein QMM87_04470 [Leptospira santarosai]|uniref:hypothetical protein n=1 Tax=Leptospira santarosai TaxID=28183 RepID=UPI0024AED3A3|nr:hypothetical protein [Leptospira santarosai]MDI7227932.1 hypothetical protein [Leptospira santarosai]